MENYKCGHKVNFLSAENDDMTHPYHHWRIHFGFQKGLCGLYRMPPVAPCEQWLGLWLVAVYKGWNTSQLYTVGILTSPDKDSLGVHGMSVQEEVWQLPFPTRQVPIGSMSHGSIQSSVPAPPKVSMRLSSCFGFGKKTDGNRKKRETRTIMLEVNGIRNFTKRYHKNDGPAGKCISFASNMASFWVSILNFRWGSPWFFHKTLWVVEKTVGKDKNPWYYVVLRPMILCKTSWDDLSKGRSSIVMLVFWGVLWIGPFYIDFYMTNHEIGIFTTGDSWKSLQMIHPSFNLHILFFFQQLIGPFAGGGAESSRQSFGWNRINETSIYWHPCRGIFWINRLFREFYTPKN